MADKCRFRIVATKASYSCSQANPPRRSVRRARRIRTPSVSKQTPPRLRSSHRPNWTRRCLAFSIRSQGAVACTNSRIRPSPRRTTTRSRRRSRPITLLVSLMRSHVELLSMVPVFKVILSPSANRARSLKRQRREVLSHLELLCIEITLLTVNQTKLERVYTDDDTGVYLINQGTDRKGNFGFCGHLPSESCPKKQADVGWQAQLKLTQMSRGETSTSHLEERCNCWERER